MKALIDDMVLYKAACCAIQKEWSYITTEGDIVVVESYLAGKDLVKQYKGGDLVYKEIDRGFQACLFAVKQILRRILKDTEADEYVFVLSNREEKCFRYKVATLKPYKGNRPPKPQYYNDLYEYFIRNHPCVIAQDGLEVDDELGIMQSEDLMNTIIATSDKDLLQIPGLKYNLDSRAVRMVQEDDSLELVDGEVKGSGYRWFYAQMLLGDAADNIPRVPARAIPGEAKLVSERILEGLKGSLPECEKFVFECFKNAYPLLPGDDYPEARQNMTEIGNLVKIHRQRNVLPWSIVHV